MIGTKLAHYDITSHLGSGGMGEVYRATDIRLGQAVAARRESVNAVRLYRESKWDHAIETFANAAMLNPADLTSAMYLNRLSIFEETSSG